MPSLRVCTLGYGYFKSQQKPYYKSPYYKVGFIAYLAVGGPYIVVQT